MKISIIIPVLNVADIIDRCLDAIARQQLGGASQVEVLVIDGGSTDGTQQLVAERGRRWTLGPIFLLENPRRVAEEAKLIGLHHAKGEYILFLDADNVLATDDFLTRTVAALERNPEIHGHESEYLPGPGMSSFCRYLTCALHISDPLSWKLAEQPHWSAGWRMNFPADGCYFDGKGHRPINPRFAWPIGANGFLYRRSGMRGWMACDPDGLDDNMARGGEIFSFEDTEVARATCAQNGWIRQYGVGVQHYIVEGKYQLLQFLQKRRRQTFHYLRRRDHLQNPSRGSWIDGRSKLWAVLYCLSVIGPCWTTFWKLFPVSKAYYTNSQPGHYRGRDWLWHPLACWLSVAGAAWGALTYAWHLVNFGFNLREVFERESELQP